MSRFDRILRVLGAALLAAAAVSCSQKAEGKKIDGAGERKATPVRLTPVEARQVRRQVESVGSLFAYEQVSVSSEVEGRVEEVLADVGDRVSAGQPLVRVSPVELRLAVDQQRALLEQARARLGLGSGGEDLKDVRSAAEVRKAAADLADAEQKFRRGKSLFEQGLLPRENFEENEAKYTAAKAAYELAIQTVQDLRAQLQRYRVSLALAEKKLNDAVIRAPFAGQVKERSVTQGEYLKVQTPVAVIVNVDPLRVRLKVPEKMAAWIRVGQPVTLQVEAYPGRTFSGKLWRINPAVDQQTRAFEAEALVENHDGILKPGFFVKGSIPSERVDSALFVPNRAVRYNYGVYKVFVANGQAVEEREVKVGDPSGDSIEIVEGLRAGERVAVAVEGELHDGAAIEAIS